MEMQNTFFKLCNDDPVCRVNIPKWQAAFDSWAVPSDTGWCIQIVSGNSYEVDEAHPFPFKNEQGNLKTWREVVEQSALVPVKETWAPLKTYIQTNCRKTKRCGAIGNWESTINRIDGKLNKN